ncbi:MAG TPA: hypothetical protein VH062_00670 [Polyangiaceae bacterium]|jgi:hypothetical protein|nr:hypothetical protein [Polyangiaceae bacterium]
MQASTTTDSGERTTATRTPAIDGAAAARLMASARRSYAIAELVQERRLIGNVDSAIPAHRALSELFELALRLNGDDVPADFTERSARVLVLAATEHLVTDDRADDLALLHAMRERVVKSEGDVTGAEDRRYDRAFVRAAEWFDGIESYLEQHYPPAESRWTRRARWGLGVAAVFALGVVIGRHVRPEGASVTEVPLPPTNLVAMGAPPTPPPLSALETPARLVVTDAHVTCKGCWPVEGSLSTPYAWTSGKIELVVRGLVARRRYRVTLGITDAGHVERLRFEPTSGDASTEVTLDKGEATSTVPLTADGDGTLTFGVSMNAWKPSEHVKGSSDARELGVALADVRIADAPEHGAPSASASASP